MSRELEQEALDVAKWWTYHKDECSDVAKRVDFQMRAIDHLLWLLGRAVQDIKNLEAGYRLPAASSNILLPMGVRLDGDVRTRG